MGSERSLKWVWRGSALGVLVIGWLFILIQNSFHVTAPVIYIALAYFAGVASIYALFRTGASAVEDVSEADDPDSWGLPQSARDELEREKRTLLKAIKEAEFDHQMGKLTKRDLDEMVRTYRLRAIEVIKLLEGTGGTTREQIQREVKARLEVAAVHAKIERAHAAVHRRKNPKRAAAAAQAAARAAAAAGASPAVAAAAAQAAAVATDDDAKDTDEADKAEHKAEKTDEAEHQAEKPDEAEHKAEKTDRAEHKAEDKAEKPDKPEDKAENKAEKADEAKATADSKDAPAAKEATS